MKQKHKLALGASIVALASLGGIKAQAAFVQEIINAAVPVANDYGLYPSVNDCPRDFRIKWWTKCLSKQL